MPKEALRRVRRVAKAAAPAWPLLQGTAAATVAWVIAKHVVDHHEPFFAPIAAVIALNAPLGERGRNAIRLLLGVVVGIAAAELSIAALGDGYWTLAVATFAAMSVALALGGARITIAQGDCGLVVIVRKTSALGFQLRPPPREWARIGAISGPDRPARRGTPPSSGSRTVARWLLGCRRDGR
jgi:hypothetical protein